MELLHTKTNGLVIKQSCTYISKVKHHKCIKCKITNSTCNCTIISLNSIKLVVFSRFIKFQRNMVFLLNESSPRIYFQSKNIARIATQTVAVPGSAPSATQRIVNEGFPLPRGTRFYQTLCMQTIE